MLGRAEEFLVVFWGEERVLIGALCSCEMCRENASWYLCFLVSWGRRSDRAFIGGGRRGADFQSAVQEA